MPTLPGETITITKLIEQVEEINGELRSDSCGLGGPFINYPDPNTGTAPVINFNVPQTTAFTTYGYMAKFIDQKYFKEFTKVAPENNFFNSYQNLSTGQIAEIFTGHPDPGYYDSNGYPVSPTMRAASAGGITVGANPGNASAAGIGLGSTGTIAAPAGTSTRPPFLSRRPSIIPSISSYASKGLRPMLTHRLGNQGQTTVFVAEPPKAIPRITVIEEYTTVSFLGDYGAGKVVKTMSLAPGERTTISVRTYKDMSSTRDKAQNVLDSYS